MIASASFDSLVAVVSVLIFAYGKWVRGMDLVSLFQAVVAIAVSAIPEGLPTLITITLAIGVQRPGLLPFE